MGRYGGALVFLLAFAISEAGAARIKDIERIRGPKEIQLVGYGLVVGLNGTGDRFEGPSLQALSNMLGQFGMRVLPHQIRSRNVASVVVTAVLHPFLDLGKRLDVDVASVGDATGLGGGILLRTILYGPDGTPFALAQGKIAQGKRRSKDGRNVVRISEGALVENRVMQAFVENGWLRLSLDRPDFQTAVKVEEAIRRRFGPGLAKAEDGATIAVQIPPEFVNSPVAFVARLGGLNVTPDGRARVVIEEKTGTVVLGERTRVLPAAVSVKGLEVRIEGSGAAGQEAAFKALDPGERLEDLVRSLNALGAGPDQIVAVLKALKAGGFLVAELELI